MPGKLKVQIVAARDLPVMDRASDLADAFVEVKHGQVTHKTEVCRKSLNPQWQSEWFKFEVDDEELQDEPLQLRIMDYDTYSAHDAIGKVYIDLNPLLLKDGPSEILGWLPIYDTMHGIRGEISVVVKVDLLENVSKFKESSCGVQFFSSSGIPTCYTVSAVYGFVEELVVNDDPEYQWIDMIRTPRASNEARQQLFTKLSGELQRKIGLKVLEREGNAILGYWQCFDLEGESGIVVRGIGTAALIHRTNPMTSPLSTSPPQDQLNPKEFSVSEDVPDGTTIGTTIGSPPYTNQLSQPTPKSPSKIAPCRHSSDSDLSSTHLGSQEKQGSGGSGGLSQRLPKPTLPPITIDILEYPFFTIKKLPPGFLVHLGGVVTARSVKLLDRIHNPDEPETRDAWWTEIRTEIRSHAAAMGCHAVVGYKETTSICDEICLLSATGTAAIVNLAAFKYLGIPLAAQSQPILLTASLDRQDSQQQQVQQQNSQEKTPPLTDSVMSENPTAATESCQKCAICHIPYNESSLPFPVTVSKCGVCKRSKVPDVLFTTVEPPPELPYTGRGCCIHASVCRSKKKAAGESNAAVISDALPFMEYEIHRQLMNKLKVKGMNALFGLRVQMVVGETLLIGTATATAAYVTALQPPTTLRVTSKVGGGEKQVQAIQKKLHDITARNRDIYELHLPESMSDFSALDSPQPVIDATEDLTDTQFLTSQKDTYVLTVDDVEDKETVWGLFDPELPTGLFSCTTETVPGNLRPSKHLQMFTMMRTQTLPEASTKHFAPIFDDLIQSMCFKLRSMAPCCLCSVCYDVNIPDDDVIQLWLTASAVDLTKNATSSPDKALQNKGGRSTDSELLFAMEELQVTEGVPVSPSTPVGKGSKIPRLEKRIVLKDLNAVPAWLPKVEITPLSIVPGGVIDQYLGYINLFFVRESMSVRESGGVSGFLYNFISEVNAIIRSHVASLGGNALVAYNLVDCIVEDRNHQCQCLINVSGDAVHVLYDGCSWRVDSPCPSQLPTSQSQQFSRDSSTEASPQIVESLH